MNLDPADCWHYLCLIQRCSRADIRAGILSEQVALRVSTHADPERAVANLIAEGLLKRVDGRRVQVVEVGKHLPDDSVRRRTERAAERKRRERAHKSGDHSLCLPSSCEDATASAQGVAAEGGVDSVEDWETARPGAGLSEERVRIAEETKGVFGGGRRVA